VETDPWEQPTKGDYAPFITVQESESQGTLSTIHSLLTGRVHDYLSEGEATLHRVSELCWDVEDIREQYPLLPVDRTVALAKQLGLPHPGTKSDPHPLTIDLLLSVRVRGSDQLRYVARSVKYWRRRVPKKDIRRAALEEAACTMLGIHSWKIATQNELPEDLQLRTKFLYFEVGHATVWDNHAIAAFLKALSNCDFRETLYKILRERVAKLTGLTSDESVRLFRYLVVTRRLKVDLRAPIELPSPHPYLATNFTLEK
jgi:hypothetical protein